MFDGVGAASSKESRAAELTKLPLLVRLAQRIVDGERNGLDRIRGQRADIVGAQPDQIIHHEAADVASCSGHRDGHEFHGTWHRCPIGGSPP
jgi:hypothetical protein